MDQTQLIAIIVGCLIAGGVIALLAARFAAKAPVPVAVQKVEEDVYVAGAKGFAALFAQHVTAGQADIAAAEANLAAVKALQVKRNTEFVQAMATVTETMAQATPAAGTTLQNQV